MSKTQPSLRKMTAPATVLVSTAHRDYRGGVLVAPLEDAWQKVLADVAVRHGLLTEPRALATAIRALSDAYNDEGVPPPRKDVLSARLAFFFPRDVPKSAGAVRELVRTGTLAMPDGRALRVLDLGAGLGASTFGVVRALAAAGARGTVEATCVDVDAEALRVAESLAEKPPALGALHLELHTQTHGLPFEAKGTFDLVLFGQVLSELHHEAAPEARAELHAEYIMRTLDRHVDAGGSLVIIEPALRRRTRHLHRVRERLLASSAVTVFAPCLHRAACPMLARDEDWCHEDLPVDLPSWRVPLARAAGLRFQGLTFSYLVLRKDGRTLGACLGGEGLARVVSQPRVSKGKRELFLCGELALGGGGTWALRLDRDGRKKDTFAAAERGGILRFTPTLDEETARVTADHEVEVVAGR